MFKKIKALKQRANKQIIKGFVSAKTLLNNTNGDHNTVSEGISLARVFVIGGIVLGFFILVFNGPIKEWLDASVGSWFKAGGETRPV